MFSFSLGLLSFPGENHRQRDFFRKCECHSCPGGRAGQPPETALPWKGRGSGQQGWDGKPSPCTTPAGNAGSLGAVCGPSAGCYASQAALVTIRHGWEAAQVAACTWGCVQECRAALRELLPLLLPVPLLTNHTRATSCVGY